MAGGSDTSKPVSTSISWPAVLVVALAGLYPALQGTYWAIPVTAAATATGIGVWKACSCSA
jgi:hypothetical protein